MKLILTSIILTFLCLAGTSQINIPAASPLSKGTQKIGLAEFEISYCRPSLNSRNLFGKDGILPYSEKWRIGANAASYIEFDEDITLQNQILSKGKYAILCTPGEYEWLVHLYTYSSSVWTTYLTEEVVLELHVPVQTLNKSQESLLIYFDDFKLHEANLKIEWGNYGIQLPIHVDEHDKIMKKIKQTLNGPGTFDYFLAALYMHENQTDLPLALNYIQKVTQNESALFFQVYREALILKDLNRNEEAIKAAERSKILSKKAGNMDLVRLNEKLIKALSS